MKFSAVTVLAAASGAMAYPGNVTVVTEVVESYVTYCPSPTTITHGSSTWTVTEPTTITITDCPCTVTKPIITTSSVVCETCTPEVPVPTVPVPTTGYQNSTIVPTVPGTPIPEPTVPGTPTPIPTAGAAKVGLSGLAGFAVIAALL